MFRVLVKSYLVFDRGVFTSTQENIRTMKTGTKIGLAFGGIALVLGFVFFIAFLGYAFFGISSGIEKSRESYKKQTAETAGTITNVRLNTSTKEYSYTYVVNGVSYSGVYQGGRSKVETNYNEKVGTKGLVCYDPSDPNSSSLYFSEFILSGDKKGEKFVCGK